MKRLNRGQRRELAALARQLVEQDPKLAEQLTSPPAPRREVWATRLGSLMLVAGVVLFSCGILVASAAMGALGAALLLSWWMPHRIVAPDGRSAT